MWIVWVTFGILAVSAAYFLPPNTSDPWRSLDSAGVVAGLYLLVLIVTTMRNPFSRRTRLLVLIAALTVGSAVAVSWIVSESQGRFQAATLLSIREHISRGVIADEMSRPLLSTLQQYYSQKGKTRRTLGKVFKDLYPDAAIAKNIYRPTFDADKLTITVAGLSDNEIILIAEEGYVGGTNPDFKNLSGNTGRVEEQARLTAQGITYERKN